MAKGKDTTKGQDCLRLAPENVIPLSAYRERRSGGNAEVIFYLHETGPLVDTLSTLPGLRVESIVSETHLRAKYYGRDPAVVLIEGNITWADPITLIEQLDARLAVPIVLICHPDAPNKDELVKRAFSAGAYDTIFHPLHRDELHETLDVLLKFQRHVSSSH